MSQITLEDFKAILSGDPEELDVHLELVQRDVTVDGHSAVVHCHCLVTDANKRVNVRRLAEFMRNSIADYAIPKSKMKAARKRDFEHNSGSAVAALYHEACATFTDLKNTGEGGEMLLFLLAERFLKIPQVLCKMDLKTDSRMHYHGADGIYADVSDTGGLKLYWGESKMYTSATAAVRNCLKSLAPYFLEDEHQGSERERDLVLLSDKADLDDPKLTNAFKQYFDRNLPQSNRVEYCGIALIAFDSTSYGSATAEDVASSVADQAQAEVQKVLESIKRRSTQEKLQAFEIQFFCVPFPSVEAFRKAFLQTLGHSDDT